MNRFYLETRFHERILMIRVIKGTLKLSVEEVRFVGVVIGVVSPQNTFGGVVAAFLMLLKYFDMRVPKKNRFKKKTDFIGTSFKEDDQDC